MVPVALKAAIISGLAARLISPPLSQQEAGSLVRHFECMQTFDRTAVFTIMAGVGVWMALGGSRAVAMRLPFVSTFIGLTALHREALRNV
jgi:hypothetical protein